MNPNSSWGFWIIILLLGYLAYLILHTFWQYLFFAVLFAVLFVGQYERLAKQINRTPAALLVVLLVLVVLVIPTFYIVANTVQQAPAAYTGAINALNKPAVRDALGVTGDEVRGIAITVGEKLRANVLTNAATYISRASDVFLGLFLLFITLFFLLRDGKPMYNYLISNLPIHKKYADKFFTHMRSIINAVVLGQLVTAGVQGLLTGVLFWVIGIPNPIFWGVITTLLSIIPVLGPFLVYLPAAGYLLLQERYVAGIVMLVFGTVVLSQVDNLIRPYVASRATSIHPLTVILGVIGGLKLWGLVGFILGPLVLAGFLALAEFATSGVHERRDS